MSDPVVTCSLYNMICAETQLLKKYRAVCCFCFLIFQHRTFQNKAVGYHSIYFLPLSDNEEITNMSDIRFRYLYLIFVRCFSTWSCAIGRIQRQDDDEAVSF